jgi:hypothetical protein
MCSYLGWNIQQYFTAVDGHGVWVCDEEGIVSDTVFGKDIRARDEAIDYFARLVSSVCSPLSLCDLGRSLAESQLFAETLACDEDVVAHA